ncbi:RES family NAD+ phosphorylase [Nitratireductor sp. GZWM139]|nr:RES family NAD+ phosphorylase [Nitratireductor sp. GZWM139]MDJ1463767.1 RES family NAD+ phosphorylase [Nitratireductor sp. GZWM139]
MSLPIWTQDALRSETRPLTGSGWRLVEAQHLVSTMKLVDTLEEQELLEAELEKTKPPVPPQCSHLDFLLSTPFRYGRYPGNSRFRREGYTPGVFYASEAVHTAVAETAFYRALFFAESPETPLPRNALEFTAFEVNFAVDLALDLTAPNLNRDSRHWLHPTDYSACLELADGARAIGTKLLRYRSIRDPSGGANLAILDCQAFTASRPVTRATWHLAFSKQCINALCDWPSSRLSLPFSVFADDPRMARFKVS